MLLSAAIIVKDDAEHLDACLTSLRGLVDQVVVVDTGSSDGSIAVAEQHGALVTREPWHDDLAAPRNRALDLAAGKWILSLDADERVRGDLDAVRERLRDDDGSVGFRVRCAPRVGWTPVREHRLWRNRVDIRFAGHVHETVVPAIGAAAGAGDLRVDPLDPVTIHRVGEDRDHPATRGRLERMLLTELVRRPDRARVYDDLALLYEAAGDSERAVETWKRGVAVARVRHFSDPDDRLLHLDLVNHLLARELIDVDLEALVEEARAAYVRTPTLELAAARLAFATGRPRDALEPLEWLVGLDDDDIIATGASYDERVFGEWSWGLIGLCRFALGDDEAAADAFRRAERYAPGDASYVVRRRLAEARAGSSA
jgi:glycosyltransferase involved in cell wall biosynthesis